MIKQCEECGKEHSVKLRQLRIGRGKCCSVRCAVIVRSRRIAKEREKLTKKCSYCGKTFTRKCGASTKKFAKVKYCSKKCWEEERKNNRWVERRCKNPKCKKPFRVMACTAKAGNGLYCNFECYLPFVPGGTVVHGFEKKSNPFIRDRYTVVSTSLKRIDRRIKMQYLSVEHIRALILCELALFKIGAKKKMKTAVGQRLADSFRKS